MRRQVPGSGVGVVCAAWLVALSVVARADAVVPWQSAGSYENEVVTVEGDVASARLEADTCVLEFSAEDPKAFRVVLVIPLMSDLPRQPQRLYEGKRVRATGKVRSWQGRPEMVLRSPDAIEVVGVAAAAPEGAPPTTVPPPPAAAPVPAPRPPIPVSPPPTAPPIPAAPPPAVPSTTLPPRTPPPPAVTPAPPAPPPTTVPPAPLPRASTPTTLAAPPVAPTPPPAVAPEQDEPLRLPRRVDPCDAARERWRWAAAAADARAAELSRCLRAGDYRCRAAAAAMAAPLSELEWAEQRVEAACP